VRGLSRLRGELLAVARCPPAGCGRSARPVPPPLPGCSPVWWYPGEGLPECSPMGRFQTRPCVYQGKWPVRLLVRADMPQYFWPDRSPWPRSTRHRPHKRLCLRPACFLESARRHAWGVRTARQELSRADYLYLSLCRLVKRREPRQLASQHRLQGSAAARAAGPGRAA
jgi:hypothetical protein